MLQSLHVKNLALMEEAEVEFGPGLNIITGETGAGKSLLLGSVNLALGAKADSSMIRKGADYALVELVFSNNSQIVFDRLKEMDLEDLGDGTVLISRKIMEGGSSCKINGEKVSTRQLKELSGLLLDIHGQHEHQSLLHKASHLQILDGFCGEAFGELYSDYKEAYKRWREKKELLLKETEKKSNIHREQELALFEWEEIEKASLTEGEDEELESRYRKYSNLRKIMESGSEVYQLTQGEQEGAASYVGAALRILRQITGYDSELEDYEQTLGEIEALLSDFNRGMKDYLSDLEYDESAFLEMEARMNLVNHLKDRYGRTIADILSYKESLQSALDKYADYDAYLNQLSEEVHKAYLDVQKLGEALRNIRKKQALILEKQLSESLLELNFLAADFCIHFESLTEPGANGLDDVEFLISTNPGMEPRPLKEVASGGELSRIMLAIRTLMAGIDDIDTLIFDEIDTGISGKTAWKVSSSMMKVSRLHQVLCITHLPQIAAMADSHYVIEKQIGETGTLTNVSSISGEESMKELARLLGSDELTETALENARQMRSQALELKEEGI